MTEQVPDHEFELNTVYPLTEVDTEDRVEAKCTACTTRTAAWPVEQLSAVKISTRANPRGRREAGHWLVYCPEHLERYLNPDAGKRRAARPQVAPPQPKVAVCPTCFMAVPTATGVCDTCD